MGLAGVAGLAGLGFRVWGLVSRVEGLGASDSVGLVVPLTPQPETLNPCEEKSVLGICSAWLSLSRFLWGRGHAEDAHRMQTLQHTFLG